jgi:hypothetical protein
LAIWPAEIDGQFSKTCLPGAWKHDLPAWIVELEATEVNCDEMTTGANDIADREDGVGVAILAKEEVADPLDHPALVVDHRL